jgi:hypothetical protein
LKEAEIQHIFKLLSGHEKNDKKLKLSTSNSHCCNLRMHNQLYLNCNINKIVAILKCLQLARFYTHKLWATTPKREENNTNKSFKNIKLSKK